LVKFFERIAEGFMPYGPMMAHAWVANKDFKLYHDRHTSKTLASLIG
jgi:hypothetical protein